MPFSEAAEASAGRRSGRFADKGKWVRYVGPRKGKGWKRGDTIVYGPNPPGHGSGKSKPGSRGIGPGRRPAAAGGRGSSGKRAGGAEPVREGAGAAAEPGAKAKEPPTRDGRGVEVPHPEGLRTTAKLSSNAAKAAVWLLRNRGKEAAAAYMVNRKHVDPRVAEDAVASGRTLPPAGSSTIPEGIRRRRFCVGDNPKRGGRVWNAVLDRMMHPEEGPPTAREVAGRKKVQILSTDPNTGEADWYDLSECNLGHVEDVVVWWNHTGKYFKRPGGRVAREVRRWMNDPKNYTLEHWSHNFSKGGATAAAGHRFEDPVG
jgi:hypothetical protein